MRHRADDARSLPRRVLDPGRDARGDEALGGGDAHTATSDFTPYEAQARRSRGSPSDEVRVLHRLAGGALAEVVDRADHDRACRSRWSAKTRDLGARRCRATRSISGVDALRAARARPSLPAYAASSSRAQVVGRRRRRNRSRAARAGPAAGAGRTSSGEAERLPDLGRVPVARRPRTARSSRARSPRATLAFSDAAGAGHRPTSRRRRPRRRSTSRERREREQRGGRVAAGVRDQAARRRRQLGQAVAPRRPARMLDPYHCGRATSSRSRCAPERSTTTPASGGSNAAGALVVEAEEDQVGAARRRLGVRARTPAARRSGEPRVERGRRLAGLRVRAERDRLELGVVRARGRASPGRCSRRSRGWRRSSSRCVLCTTDEIYAGAQQHLVLEDGTVFPGVAVGRRRRRRRRGLLHDRDDRLRGGRHRPELRRAGALLLLSADRDVRRRRGADGVRPRAVRGRRDARRAARVRGLAARARRRRADRGRHADARAQDPRRRRPALRARRRAGRGAPRARARRAADRRQPAAARAVGTKEPYSVGAGPRVVVVDLGVEALDPAPARGRPGVEAYVVPGDVGRRRDPRGRRRARC